MVGCTGGCITARLNSSASSSSQEGGEDAREPWLAPKEPSWSVSTFFRSSSGTPAIDAATLRAVAKRAQLHIKPEKEETLCREVAQILGCVRTIQEVRTGSMTYVAIWRAFLLSPPRPSPHT